jgi:hypothetical protein
MTATGWIKFEKALITDPRVRRVARQLSVTLGRDGSNGGVTLVLGALVTLWAYADTHISDDDLLLIGADDIDDVVGVPGFAKALPTDWLQIIDAESVKLPGFHAHNGTLARHRAAAAKRQKRYRSTVTPKRDNRNDKPSRNPSPDQTRPNQTRSNKAATPPAQKKPVSRGSDQDPEFLDFKLAYPPRSGDPRWRGGQIAARARLKEGHTWAEMVDGAKRYASYCNQTGKGGTEYVQSAATFLGPGKPFLLPWNAPVKPTHGNGREAPKDPDVDALAAAHSLGFKQRPGEPQADFLKRFREFNARRISKLGHAA